MKTSISWSWTSPRAWSCIPERAERSHPGARASAPVSRDGRGWIAGEAGNRAPAGQAHLRSWWRPGAPRPTTPTSRAFKEHRHTRIYGPSATAAWRGAKAGRDLHGRHPSDRKKMSSKVARGRRRHRLAGDQKWGQLSLLELTLQREGPTRSGCTSPTRAILSQAIRSRREEAGQHHHDPW
jgi:hypothetical protein